MFKLPFIYLSFLLLFSMYALALPVSYDITLSGTVDGTSFSKTQNEVKECDEGMCVFDVPVFETPVNFTFSNYTLSQPSELIKSLAFESTNDVLSTLITDKITLTTKELKEELKIGRLVTKNLVSGQNTIVLQIENIGTKDLKEVHTEISGDGVKTMSSQRVSILRGQSDFTTTFVSVTNTGTIDIIIKAYAGDVLLGQTIETISVPVPQQIDTEVVAVVDIAYAQEQVELLWSTVTEYERVFLTKRAEEYVLTDLTDALDKINEEIKDLELRIPDMTKESFDREVSLIKRSLDDVKLQLDHATPKKFTDKLKENVGAVAAVIGTIVSALTAYGLAKTHVAKGKEKKK